MPSTYSPSLRIELIGAGEQAGTWNTTTNTNLGTLVETAIAGNVTVSVTSANQALIAINGVTDQARQAILTLTTTTTAPFAIYAPPQTKQYVVYNTTAYAATIYNSTVLGNTTAAGAGVVIPAGKKLIVFSDSTSFYTTETANLTGVLAVANGGTGVTTSTGTGSAVLNTSPTLVSPALGTPTALVGTNITGTATGLTAGNVTTNANLTGAVTSTGNATSLGSFTSAQLAGALTDETGSGAAVFATSPTFAGTPAAPTQTIGNSSTALATTAFVQAALQALHPVGSIYTSTSATNPNTSFGFGTWVQFGAGRVMMGVGGAFGAGTTGGSNDATLPSHTHTVTSSGTTGGMNSNNVHSHTATVSDPGHSHNLLSAVISTLSDVGTLNGSAGLIGGYNNGTNGTVSGYVQAAATGISVSNSAVDINHTHGVTVSGTTESAGSSATNANLQPYIVVYIWNRTA